MRVYLFCRYPEFGKVKTRLAAGCGDANALLLYEKMLKIIFQNLKESGREVLVHTAGGDSSLSTDWLKGFHHIEQVDGDLGERLIAAVNRGFDEDDSPIVLIGSDCPEIDKALLNEAEKLLCDNDVVIGPAEDGGYYLMAIKESNAELFTGVDWGTEDVLDQTLMSCNREKLSVALLEEKNDIDRLEDVPEEWLKELKI